MAWEAKSEYVLPYFPMLFPYSIRGIRLLLEIIRKMIQKRVCFSKNGLFAWEVFGELGFCF